MYHWAEPRALTNRERARLQTFPDRFEFIGGRPSVRRQVGMAVPPDGAQAVVEAMLKTLDGVGYAVDRGGPNVDVDTLIHAYEIEDERTATEALPDLVLLSDTEEAADSTGGTELEPDAVLGSREVDVEAKNAAEAIPERRAG